jgi:hypothetical protein
VRVTERESEGVVDAVTEPLGVSLPDCVGVGGVRGFVDESGDDGEF